MIIYKNILVILFLLHSFSPARSQTFNIRDFDAVPDGSTINTNAIQQAIDRCSEQGGRVVIPKGVFVSGTLFLKSNIELHIEEGGVLKGSPSFKDYPTLKINYVNALTHKADGQPHPNKALLFAEQKTNISLTGKGTIDGSGNSPVFQLGNDVTPESRARPYMLLFVDSKKISVSGLFLTNSAYWIQNYLGCEDIHLNGLRIFNHSNYNQDGMDIDAINVLVENCVIDVDDDGICFKSHDRNRIPRNITVRNCTISTNCNAIKFGTSSIGGLRDVTISNCVIRKASVSHIRDWQHNLAFIGQPITVLSGIALESVDGGIIENIRISNIVMDDVQTPLFIVLGNRGQKQVGDTAQPTGIIRNISISDITATSYSKMSSSITAFPGQYVENVQLQNIRISTMGRGTLAEAATPLMESPGAYPENRMYGQVFPASGLFVRHVKGLKIKNIQLTTREQDYRPAIIFDDVMNSCIAHLEADRPAGKMPVIRLVQSKDITIDHPVAGTKDAPLLQLSGTGTREVKMKGFRKYKGWITE